MSRIYIHKVDDEYINGYGQLNGELPASHAMQNHRAELRSTDSGFPVDAWTKFVTWRAEHQRLMQEQAAYRNKVSAFLQSHTTLRAALTEWPALWEIVPKQYQDRHNAATGRQASTPRPQIVDVGDLNAGLVIAKLSQGKDKLD